MKLEAAIRSQLLLQWFDRSVPLASGRWANERIPSTMHCFAVRRRGPAQIHQGFLEASASPVGPNASQDSAGLIRHLHRSHAFFHRSASKSDDFLLWIENC